MPLCRDVDDICRRILSPSLCSRPTLADERVDDLYRRRLSVETGSVRETAPRRTKYTIAEACRLPESFNFRASTRIGTMPLNHLAYSRGRNHLRRSRDYTSRAMVVARIFLFMGGLVNALWHCVYSYADTFVFAGGKIRTTS